MRNLILSLIAVAFLSTPVSAQYFGLRAGVNDTNASFDFGDFEVDTEGQSHLMLGIFFDLPLGTDVISIQPELNYLNRGYSYEVSVGNLISQERTLAYLDLGALVKLNFGREEGLGFYVGAGPMYSYAVSGTVTEVNGERDVDFDSDRLNRGELQFAGVSGLTFNVVGTKIFVEARYNGSLGDQSSDDDIEIRQRSFGVNGGILIPLNF